MTDTHCHLDTLDDPAAAIAGALAAGCTLLVSIGANVVHAEGALALAAAHAEVYASVGLHPSDAAQDSPATRAALRDLMARPKVVAIGESGLDYYWDSAPRPVQQAALEWQLAEARTRSLPIVIHTRDKDNSQQCYLDCGAILANAGWSQGILHCFSGHRGLMTSALELGFYISFAGNLTYKNASPLRETVQDIPLERLLVETDAPYLAPVPQRGQRNTPAYVRHTLQQLADLRGLSFGEMEAITDANARRVFGLA
jgi:TatD DNase family protein